MFCACAESKTKKHKFMNTIENNRLIAKFMGAKKSELNSFDFSHARPDNQFLQYWHEYKLRYHTDWNWLMPVIQKINETGYAGGIIYELKESLMAVDIDNTYKEVVEFIKWYNEGKTKNI